MSGYGLTQGDQMSWFGAEVRLRVLPRPIFHYEVKDQHRSIGCLQTFQILQCLSTTDYRSHLCP